MYAAFVGRPIVKLDEVGHNRARSSSWRASAQLSWLPTREIYFWRTLSNICTDDWAFVRKQWSDKDTKRRPQKWQKRWFFSYVNKASGYNAPSTEAFRSRLANSVLFIGALHTLPAAFIPLVGPAAYSSRCRCRRPSGTARQRLRPRQLAARPRWNGKKLTADLRICGCWQTNLN